MVELICNYCAKKFKYNRKVKYCSTKCRNKYNKELKKWGYLTYGYKKNYIKICEICGIKFYGEKSKFSLCSQKCRHKKWYAENRLKKLKQNKEYKLKNNDKMKKIWNNYYNKTKNKQLIRKYTRDNYTKKNNCEICNSIKNLEFHHTSYNPIKIITLCQNCHLKLHNKQEVLK